MISVEEIYFLNRALDGKEIYGIEPAVKNKLDLFEAEKIKQNLIKEKILDKDGSINDLAFLILRNLEMYKNSSNYIWINNIVMSMDKSNFLIYFEQKSDGRLIFKKTTKDAMLFNIIKQYEFLWDSKEEKDSEINIPIEDFIGDKVLVKESKDVLYIEKVKNRKVILCDAYYKEDNKIFKYDFTKEKLIKANPLEIRKGFLDLFNMEVD